MMLLNWKKIKYIDYYCLCGKPVFIKNESIEFINKKGTIVQRKCRFSHFRNCCCIVKKAFSTISDDDIDNKVDDAPETTVIDKRIKIIRNILYYYKKSILKFYSVRTFLKNSNIIAINNNIDFNIYTTDFIYKVLYNNTKAIGFKDIEAYELDYNNSIYIINDLFLKDDNDKTKKSKNH